MEFVFFFKRGTSSAFIYTRDERWFTCACILFAYYVFHILRMIITREKYDNCIFVDIPISLLLGGYRGKESWQMEQTDL